MQLGRSLTLRWRDVAMVRVAMTVALALLLGAVTPAQAAGLDRARGQGKMILGYRADARPFSYKDDAGKAAGYSVALCQKIVDAAKAELSLPKVDVEFVEVTSTDRFDALEQGRIDLLCGSATATLERRRQVAFSIPIFPSGIGALVRAGCARAAEGGAGRTRAALRATLARIAGSRPRAAGLLGRDRDDGGALAHREAAGARHPGRDRPGAKLR